MSLSEALAAGRAALDEEPAPLEPLGALVDVLEMPGAAAALRAAAAAAAETPALAELLAGAAAAAADAATCRNLRLLSGFSRRLTLSNSKLRFVEALRRYIAA